MTGIFKKHHGMNIIGQGGKIILFTLPSLLAAVAAQRFFPWAALPESIRFIQPAGYIFLVPGLILWGAAMVQLLVGFSNGRLVTGGAYGVVRNPIYASAALFLLPAAALLTFTWVYFVPAVCLYAGVMIFIGEEEKRLTGAFGEEYTAYLTRVDRMVPFKTPKSVHLGI